MGIENEHIALFILVLLFNLTLILAIPHPFQLDEGTYAVMIKDISEHPEHITPAINGEHVEWKPPLFFWIYGFFYYFLKNLTFLPLETVFRLPSAFFGALNAVLLFKVGRKLYDEKTAFMSMVIYVLTPLTILLASLVMMEVLAVFFFLLGAYFYLDKKTWRAALCLALLTQIKWLYSFALVVLMFVYFFKDDYRKNILLSILAIPLSIITYLLISMIVGSLPNAVYTYTIIDLGRLQIPSIYMLILNFYQLLIGSPITVLVVFGILLLIRNFNFYKERLLVASALLLFLLPFSGRFLYWYVSPLLPFISIIPIVAIAKEQETLRKILFSVLIIATLISVPVVFYNVKSINKDVREVVSSFKNEERMIFYAMEIPDVWFSIKEKYVNTNMSALLIEPMAPGFLFYAFEGASITNQYVTAVFHSDNRSIKCEDAKVVIISNYFEEGEGISNKLPDCFVKQGMTKNEEYIIYKKG